MIQCVHVGDTLVVCIWLNHEIVTTKYNFVAYLGFYSIRMTLGNIVNLSVLWTFVHERLSFD